MRRPEADNDAAGKFVFRVLHGAYGTLFLNRYASGKVDDKGSDLGQVSAIRVWSHGLRAFDAEVIKTALDRCMERDPKFPPTLPELQVQCRAAAPRKTFTPEGPRAIGMSDQLRSSYARRLRDVIAKHEERRVHRATGYRELPKSLDGLKAAVADAVACAGGDEAAELLRLDRMFARSA